jgi:hypothetical protein
MKTLLNIKKFFLKEKLGTDPVSDFFLHSSASERKRVYKRALEGAEKDQLRIIELAKDKQTV